VKRFFNVVVSRFRSIPLAARISGGVVLLAILYVGVFVIPTNVQFSYANKETCTDWFMVAPTLQQQRAGKNSYTITPSDTVKVFGAPLFSRSVCVTPSTLPEEGRTKVSIAPFGLPIFSKTVGVSTPATPVAKAMNLKDTDISAVKPLLLPLSTKDAVHTYSLRQGEKSTTCAAVDQGISCPIKSLALEPSTSYDLTLYRGFNEDTPKKVDTLAVKTLKAVQLVESTLQNDMTIYTKPTSFTYTFDRPIESVGGVLQRVDGTSKTDVKTTLKAEGSTVVVTAAQQLPRNASYQLTLEEVTGRDGASLADPLVTIFKTSGGPKVVSVSVGSSLVPQSAKITVTFDQPVKGDIDLAKFASSAGIASTVSRASDTSITFALSPAALCTAFSLVIEKGLPSGSNDETSTEQWKFDSRIACGYSSVIGYSIKGRAIIAYTFGSGGSVILFTGGMHGSEPSSTSTMQAWVNYLQSNGFKIPADKKVVIVPNTNPDGIAAGSRNNANNVNIDRNFPASNWRPDIDTASGTLPTGGGTSAGSEPETAALIALTRSLRPRLEVSFHAQGSLVGANQYGDSIAIGTKYARTVGYGTMIGNAEEVMGYSITGEYEDWMGQEMGIPAILIELPTTSGNYLNSQLTALLNLLPV